ncbi:nucleotidyltransferase domain-containing protein [Candidatus Aciduliprofundum boonei]|uniref:DNA polymerase beta domain protein region n=1 Tax=Aciduliprofundum boonei (strain DSM 19572 / T469) TaxID=439481 RepID=B5IER7_ACIB4|nr:nucleotidyltransferase domain-containing protein [Candidatus Aciduliprofundum boonei]ADD07943.1 DNA polymerase beta domain protein region [Aciduliprofundum boonei T469]EDY35220.1 Nucleotidyltransferase domain protein [Aciduliprofundum boonei T469]HII55595.1 nucleotidyltransferase [Candidatus Aciduliprofundum boonei]
MDYEERLKIAKKWADLVVEKYGEMIKSIVLFGSLSRGVVSSKSDIDVVVIVDDPKQLPTGFLESMDNELERIKDEIDGHLLEIHPTYTLTEFWDNARMGNPVIYNIIKEGVALYDVGVFEPLQQLWLKGKIPHTKEAVDMQMKRAMEKIERAEVVKIMQIAEDCYYAIIDSAQALFMALGEDAPQPKKLYGEMMKNLVAPGILESQYAEWVKEIVELRDKIKRREIKEIKGEDVDLWIDRAKKIVGKMEELIEIKELGELSKIVLRTLEIMAKAVVEGLIKLGKEVPGYIIELAKIESTKEFIEKYEEIKIDELKREFKNAFIDSRKLDEGYMLVWNRLEELKNDIENKNFEKVERSEVLALREAVREMIRKIDKNTQKV